MSTSRPTLVRSEFPQHRLLASRFLTVASLAFAFAAFHKHPSPLSAQEPVVAKRQMKLTLEKKVLDVIEKGDLLTVLAERDSSYVIRTFNGQKGAVSKGNAVPLAEAVPIYDDLIDENPDEGRLYTLRAGAHWAVGDAEKALADYSAAIDEGYDEAHAYSSRGLFLASMGKFDEAIEDYTAAIEKDPEEEIALLNRAGVYMSMGKYEDAVADYSAASKLNPKNPVTFSQRAVAHKLLGDLPAAIKDYGLTLQLAEKDVTAHMGRGFVHFQLGKHKEAIADFSNAIELSPESAVALNNRGFNYQALDKHDLAIKDFSRAVELAPQYVLALQNKGWLLTICEDKDLRDPMQAVETAEKLCELSEFKDPSNLTLLAASYASGGDFESAIGWQEKVIEIATEQQSKIAKQILELYKNEQELDPTLLEVAEDTAESASSDVNTTKPAENAEEKNNDKAIE